MTIDRVPQLIIERARSWRQFRLSSLLTATAVLCAWLACHVNRVHREHRAINALERAGIYVTIASNAPEWVPNWLDKAWFQYVIAVNCPGSRGWSANTVEWGDPTAPMSNIELYFLIEPRQGKSRDVPIVTDDLTPNIAAFNYCKALHLTNAKIGDDGLQYLACLRHLQVLWLNGTNITDAGLPRLSRLDQLRLLVINNTKITDRGVETLQRALPDCDVSFAQSREL